MNHRILLFILLLGFITRALADTEPPYWTRETSVEPALSLTEIAHDLQAILPLYEEAMLHPWPLIPSSPPLLKKGFKNKAVLLLKARLEETHELEEDAHDPTLFDQELTQAIKQYQARNGLKADGVVGAQTRAALNISPEQRVKQIRANLARLVPFANPFDDRYILVNIPEYQLHLIDHGREVLNLKVIVGKPDHPTPELASEITRLVFNPPWNIPSRIAKNDIIPKIMEDPNYLAENHIKIFSSPEEDANELNPQEINWQSAIQEGFQYHFRQMPGLDNALGLVKFEFQNTHDVYLHDTPAKSLFDLDKRDFSHGCIRLENPFSLVNYLTQDDPRLDTIRIGEILERAIPRYFKIKEPIPIYVAYLTAWVDPNKMVHFAEDIYGRDQEDLMNKIDSSNQIENDDNPIQN